MRFPFSQTKGIKDHILTSVFIFLGLIMLVSRHDEGLQNVRKASITVFSYLEEPLSNIRVYRTALKTNRQLHEQNIILLDELSRLRSAREQNIELKRLLDFKESSEHDVDILPVKVVGKNLTGINNFMSINVGSNDSVEVGMPVINPSGLVGRVVDVSANYAQVMPFLNPLFRVSSRIQETRAYGVVSWESQKLDELVMNYVPQTIPVEIGAIVETSGYSQKFPVNIPIGQVIRTAPDPGLQTQRIYLKPFVSLFEIAEASVMKYTGNPEVDSLRINFMERY
ncbi:MAG: rod shape-determining protein MreC [Balneolales bacterium]